MMKRILRLTNLLVAALFSTIPLGAHGVEEGAGTRINVRSLEASRDLDPRGLTLFRLTRRRAPSGFLYPFPFAPHSFRNLDENILWRGVFELGAIADGERTGQAYWNQYVDRDPRILLNDFSLDLFHR